MPSLLQSTEKVRGSPSGSEADHWTFIEGVVESRLLIEVIVREGGLFTDPPPPDDELTLMVVVLEEVLLEVS